VDFEIEARNVPVGAVVNLRLINENEGLLEFDSQPLAGTDELSTATATTVVLAGFSRITAEASFQP
jgi:hypothetical protein